MVLKERTSIRRVRPAPDPGPDSRNFQRRLRGAFRKRLNRYGDLLGQEQRHPGRCRENQQGEEEENQEHLSFEAREDSVLPAHIPWSAPG